MDSKENEKKKLVAGYTDTQTSIPDTSRDSTENKKKMGWGARAR
jgi:hypothetical protein